MTTGKYWYATPQFINFNSLYLPNSQIDGKEYKLNNSLQDNLTQVRRVEHANTREHSNSTHGYMFSAELPNSVLGSIYKSGKTSVLSALRVPKHSPRKGVGSKNSLLHLVHCTKHYPFLSFAVLGNSYKLFPDVFPTARYIMYYQKRKHSMWPSRVEQIYKLWSIHITGILCNNKKWIIYNTKNIPLSKASHRTQFISFI